jgi:hypothetical protein
MGHFLQAQDCRARRDTVSGAFSSSPLSSAAWPVESTATNAQEEIGQGHLGGNRLQTATALVEAYIRTATGSDFQMAPAHGNEFRPLLVHTILRLVLHPSVVVQAQRLEWDGCLSRISSLLDSSRSQTSLPHPLIKPAQNFMVPFDTVLRVKDLQRDMKRTSAQEIPTTHTRSAPPSDSLQENRAVEKERLVCVIKAQRQPPVIRAVGTYCWSAVNAATA